MASEDDGKPAGQEPVESLIDDLIRDIFREAGQSTKARVRGRDSMTTLIETALAAPRATSGASTIERLLIAQVLASALSEALAPALAEALAPEIMKALENYTIADRTDEKVTSAAGPAQPQCR